MGTRKRTADEPVKVPRPQSNMGLLSIGAMIRTTLSPGLTVTAGLPRASRSENT